MSVTKGIGNWALWRGLSTYFLITWKLEFGDLLAPQPSQGVQCAHTHDVVLSFPCTLESFKSTAEEMATQKEEMQSSARMQAKYIKAFQLT